MSDWKYYNHALVQNCAPHETPNINEIKDELKNNKKALFARWTTDWDCGHETEWWYIIKDNSFSQDELSKSSRKNINRALKNIIVKRINPKEYIDELWNTYTEAIVKYSNIDNKENEENFKNKIKKNQNENEEYWGAFFKENNKLIGYKICRVYKDYVEMNVSKYSTEYLKYRTSDGLNFWVLDHYLNNRNIKYIINGSRSINHVTNVQEYYIEHFNFRKAYCKLKIKYRWYIKIIIDLIYPFRNILKKKNNGFMHRINAVLKMEEIRRSCEEDR